MNDWYACSEPERPTDPMVLWHYRDSGFYCVGCDFKARALAMRHPDDTHVAWVLSMVTAPENLPARVGGGEQ